MGHATYAPPKITWVIRHESRMHSRCKTYLLPARTSAAGNRPGSESVAIIPPIEYRQCPAGAQYSSFALLLFASALFMSSSLPVTCDSPKGWNVARSKVHTAQGPHGSAGRLTRKHTPETAEVIFIPPASFLVLPEYGVRASSLPMCGSFIWSPCTRDRLCKSIDLTGWTNDMSQSLDDGTIYVVYNVSNNEIHIVSKVRGGSTVVPVHKGCEAVSYMYGVPTGYRVPTRDLCPGGLRLLPNQATPVQPRGFSEERLAPQQWARGEVLFNGVCRIRDIPPGTTGTAAPLLHTGPDDAEHTNQK
ncbi:hypothetical protein PCH_Pc12g15870 [Penicillium rubens Wisconsin 54-1255]|uniref:Uncharacterized protein n=1 Tax=Penicillium rubens (strain ATCC 28089 / DSM 1075 / NRRL 1951 / Wisconsin 54-1255) TaxID=500485 RepID=B6GYE1_PENRW|nr:hypothetical protein PCH_Pc12g15870 [Penicillium rubens Wisconsin 54-1255]